MNTEPSVPPMSPEAPADEEESTPVEEKVPTADERTQIEGLSDNLRQTKLAYADMSLASEMAHSQSMKAANDVVKAQDTYMKCVEEVAKKHGIDPKDPSKGRWQFDAQNCRFVRVG